jgi:hypothetical protein
VIEHGNLRFGFIHQLAVQPDFHGKRARSLCTGSPLASAGIFQPASHPQDSPDP